MRRLEASKAVAGPWFRADAVVDEKEAVAVVVLFDLGEAGVVDAPVGVLEIGFEVVAFRNVSATPGSEGSEFAHATVNGVGSFAAFGEVRFVTADSGIGRALSVCDDGQGKGITDGRIHGGIFCSSDGFGGGAGEAFIEMKSHIADTGCCEKRVGQFLLRIFL